MAPLENGPDGSVDDESAIAERDVRKQNAIASLRAFFGSEEMDTKRRRAAFVTKCGTTWNHMQQVMQGERNVAPWLAINLDRESGGQLDMTALTVEADERHRIDWLYVRTAMRRKPRD